MSVHQEIEKTFKQLESDVDKLASSLHSIGLKKGDTAGCWSGNIYEYVVIFHALAKLGVVNCSLSTAYKNIELQYALEKAKFKALFLPGPSSSQTQIFNDFHGVMSKLNYDSLPSLKHLIYVNDEDANASLPKYGSTQVHKFDNLLNESNGIISDEIYVDPDDISSLYLTSGTTGKPKLASITHFGSLNNVQIAIFNKNNWKETEHKVLCIPLPFFHVYAGLLGLNVLSVIPATVVSPCMKYSARALVRSMDKYKCTNLYTVPTILIDVNNYIKNNREPLDLSSLDNLVVGAATVPPEVVRDSKTLFPGLKRLTIGYGATETHAITSSPKHDDEESVVLESVGTALDFVQIKVVNPKTGELVKHNETGEICVRGHHVMAGYYGEVEKTNEVIKNGWYYTGDLGTMDATGVIRIVGRTKEMIIRGGINIFPREIEDLLQGHPDVLEVAVCGIPHQKLGEEVVAWVKLYDENSKLTADDIKNYCKEHISSYKVPSIVFFVRHFPTTASGKVQKFKMSEMTIEMLKQKATHQQ